jgi:hypothetical protein
MLPATTPRRLRSQTHGGWAHRILGVWRPPGFGLTGFGPPGLPGLGGQQPVPPPGAEPKPRSQRLILESSTTADALQDFFGNPDKQRILLSKQWSVSLPRIQSELKGPTPTPLAYEGEPLWQGRTPITPEDSRHQR